MSAPVPPNRRQAFRDFLAILSLWLVVCACFWRILFAARVLASGDIFTYFHPYWSEATRALRSGRIPLWNPYLFGGAPFLANSQAGLLYPLNWPLWLALPAHRSVHLSPVLHLGLAATGAYLWTRVSHGSGRIGAWTTGLVFALGGYLGAQLEHVNQVQGLAWLPIALLLFERSFIARRRLDRGSAAAFAGLSLVVALVLLAGHTQTGFIVLFGISVYALGPPIWRAWRERNARLPLRPLILLVLALVLGLALAAVQLLPTWQLSRLSIRASGLPFNERVSFSLSPQYVARALLPDYATVIPPARLEYVAYTGVSGLVLAALGVVRRRESSPIIGAAMAFVLLGLFLSLGRYNPLYLLLARFVPGFAHFRVPARWLGLYALGAAILVGHGVQALWEGRGLRAARDMWAISAPAMILVAWAVIGARVADGESIDLSTLGIWLGAAAAAVGLVFIGRRTAQGSCGGLLLLLTAELLGASKSLPHARATAPQAYTSLRPAVAHLQVSPPGRFLSMSDITFDPGDLGELNAIYGSQLESDALYDLVIATKQQEVLSPNLPLAFGVKALDGYDGGVLPLARYVKLQHLLTSRANVSLDGRLRENLKGVPEGRWLNMLDVRYIVTDKLRDVWIDDVFYDLEFGAQLSPGAEAWVAHVPTFEATTLGVVSHLHGAAVVTDGTPVGEVVIEFSDGGQADFTIFAGEHTAEAAYGPDVRHAQPPLGLHRALGEDDGFDFPTRLSWDRAGVPTAVGIRATLPAGELVIRGLSLIDERTGSFQSLVISDQARYRLVYSGDVKIYENLDALTQAYLAHEPLWVAGDDAALAAMASSSFDPASSVVLERESGASQWIQAVPRGEACPPRSELARIIEDRPEQMQVFVETCAPAYLVISKAWYPGWEAWVDGERTPVLRANILLGAIALGEGRHTVVYTFRPTIVRSGLIVSLAALSCVILVPVLAIRCPAIRRML